jgi:hypothetical protein
VSVAGVLRGTTRRIDDALFGPETGARLVVLQGGLMGLFALRTITVPYYLMAPQPPALFRPVPMLSFLDRMPSRPVIAAAQAVVILCVLGWFVAGRFPVRQAGIRRATFIGAWAAFSFVIALAGSRGEVYHRELLLIWAAAPVLFAPTDVSFRDRERSRHTGWPIRTSIAFMSVSYFCTGFWKLRASGLDWVFSDNLQWALYWGRVRGAPPPWRELAYFIADRPVLAQISAAGILAFEILFPLVLFVPRMRPAFVVGAWLFHGGTFLMLGLDYWGYALVVTLVLVDWPPLVDRITRRTPAPQPT